MRVRDLASLAFLIMGIYALLQCVLMLQGLMSFPFILDEMKGSPAGLIVVWSFSLCVFAATGFYLIVRRQRLADTLFPEAQGDRQPLGAAQLEDLAISLIGLFFVVSALPDLASVGTGLINLRGMDNVQEATRAFRNNAAYYLGTLTQFVVGALMCLKANTFGSLLRRRRVPTAKPPAPEPSTLPECPACGKPFDPSHYRPDVADRRCSDCMEELPGEYFESA